MKEICFSKNTKIKIVKILILFMFFIASVVVYGQSDFSGSWKLNVPKSEFNETPGTPFQSLMSVEQKDGMITYQRNENPKETLKIGDTSGITINNKDFEGGKTRVFMKLSADRNGLVETRVYTYPESETAIVPTRKIRTWTLSTDKKVLTITDQIEASNGDNYVMVLVYEKQENAGNT